MMLCSALFLEGLAATAFAEELPEETVVVEAQDIAEEADSADKMGVQDVVEDADVETEIDAIEPTEATEDPTVLRAGAEPNVNNEDFEIVDGVLVKYRGNDSDVVIPDGVTDIGEEAFAMCYSLETVKLPENLRTIGAKAFYGCEHLKEIEIPNGVSDMGEAAFQFCRELTTVRLPESLSIIPSEAFTYCYNLSQIEIPNGVTEIGYYAFGCCDSLETVTLPKSFRTFGEEAFNGSNIREIEIPEGVTDIARDTFAFCGDLRTVKLPESLRTIGKGAFQYCQGLVEIEIPEGVTDIYPWAFAYCLNLRTIKLPESLRTIGTKAFDSCYELPVIVIPEKVKMIEKETFFDSGIRRIYVISKDTEIDFRAFNHGPLYPYTVIKPTVYAPIGGWTESCARRSYSFVPFDVNENFDPSKATRDEKLGYVRYHLLQWRYSLKTKEERDQVRELYRTKPDVVKAQVADSLEWLGISWDDAFSIAKEIFIE